MTATSQYLNRPLRTENEASGMISVNLSMDELTTLMHALETAKDEARKAVTLANSWRNPAYRQLCPETEAEATQAAINGLSRVSDLCDRVTDVWKENR